MYSIIEQIGHIQFQEFTNWNNAFVSFGELEQLILIYFCYCLFNFFSITFIPKYDKGIAARSISRVGYDKPFKTINVKRKQAHAVMINFVDVSLAMSLFLNVSLYIRASIFLVV